MSQVIPEAVRVKNAFLIHHKDTSEADNIHDIFELQHYNTIILRVNIPEFNAPKYENIDIFKPVSNSSIRAISQALKYFGDWLDYKELKAYWKQKGRYIAQIGEY